jgi:hypothetical protein
MVDMTKRKFSGYFGVPDFNIRHSNPLLNLEAEWNQTLASHSSNQDVLFVKKTHEGIQMYPSFPALKVAAEPLVTVNV